MLSTIRPRLASAINNPRKNIFGIPFNTSLRDTSGPKYTTDGRVSLTCRFFRYVSHISVAETTNARTAMPSENYVRYTGACCIVLGCHTPKSGTHTKLTRWRLNRWDRDISKRGRAEEGR